MPAPPSRLPGYRLPHPRLAVAWESPWKAFGSSLHALLRSPKAPRTLPTGGYFGSNWVLSPLPKRALLASALWHVVLLILPHPSWLWETRPRTTNGLTLPRIEITWDIPVRDLPPITTPGPVSKPRPPGEAPKLLPPRGADAFHPRQTIISAPLRPTHPRQTLIRPDAPPEPPKILPQLPNIVQWSEVPRVAAPRLTISREALAKLRPRAARMRLPSEVPLPEVPNLEKKVGELNIASGQMDVPAPRLPMTPAAVPALGPRAVAQDSGAAPEIRPEVASGDTSLQRLIALSTAPAPPKPETLTDLPVPAGNLSARFTISPEGPRPGVPGGSPGSTATASGGTGGAGGTHSGTGSGGNGPPSVHVSITGGNPNAASTISGLGGTRAGSGLSRASLERLARATLEPRPPTPSPSRTPPAPGFDRLKPGAPPEEILGPRRVYTLHVNAPNLSSVTGSWVLSFVELNMDDPNASSQNTADLTGPVPVRKVDPKYPPALRQEKVEGEVVLYAVIRKDGSVDSIQLVKGLDPQLDQNAMEAMARWKFRPAERHGVPVELEAIIHIPFRAIAPAY